MLTQRRNHGIGAARRGPERRDLIRYMFRGARSSGLQTKEHPPVRIGPTPHQVGGRLSARQLGSLCYFACAWRTLRRCAAEAAPTEVNQVAFEQRSRSFARGSLSSGESGKPSGTDKARWAPFYGWPRSVKAGWVRNRSLRHRGTPPGAYRCGSPGFRRRVSEGSSPKHSL
jgi:hypothetical protein